MMGLSLLKKVAIHSTRTAFDPAERVLGSGSTHTAEKQDRDDEIQRRMVVLSQAQTPNIAGYGLAFLTQVRGASP